MDQLTAEIPLMLAYALPVALLVWLWLVSRLSVRVKVLVTLLLPLVYGLHWQGLQNVKGWPTHQALPEAFELIAADVVEPKAGEGVEGAINLWIRPETTGEPRVHALPYTREVHKMLFETKQRMAAGQTQVGVLRETDSGQGAALGNGQRLEFQNATRTLLPPKH